MKIQTNLSKGYLFISALAWLLLSCAAHDTSSRTPAALPQPAKTLPLAVSAVETHRIGTQLVRIIQYDNSVKSLVDIQRIQVPDRKLLEHLELTSITLNGEVLDFAESSAAILASITIYQEDIYMTVEFYPLRGPLILVFCSLHVFDEGFSPLACSDVTPPHGSTRQPWIATKLQVPGSLLSLYLTELASGKPRRLPSHFSSFVAIGHTDAIRIFDNIVHS